MPPEHQPGESMTSTRIALWQCAQQSRDVSGNLARLRGAASEAAALGARLLVTPEMALTGYAIGAEAVATLGQPADGTAAREVAATAASLGIAILWGFPELDPTTGLVYNAAQFVDETGTARSTYRKTHLYGDLDRAQFSPSDHATGVLVDWRGWRIGLLICYDVEFPETVRALALAGADMVLVPTANMAGFETVQRTLVPARAYENGVVVAYANCCGTEADLHYGGLSVVAGPDGRVLAAADVGPALLVVDVDRADVAERRAAVLRDRRPALYATLVDAPLPIDGPG